MGGVFSLSYKLKFNPPSLVLVGRSSFLLDGRRSCIMFGIPKTCLAFLNSASCSRNLLTQSFIENMKKPMTRRLWGEGGFWWWGWEIFDFWENPQKPILIVWVTVFPQKMHFSVVWWLQKFSERVLPLKTILDRENVAHVESWLYNKYIAVYLNMLYGGGIFFTI